MLFKNFFIFYFLNNLVSLFWIMEVILQFENLNNIIILLISFICYKSSININFQIICHLFYIFIFVFFKQIYFLKAKIYFYKLNFYHYHYSTRNNYIKNRFYLSFSR